MSGGNIALICNLLKSGIAEIIIAIQIFQLTTWLSAFSTYERTQASEDVSLTEQIELCIVVYKLELSSPADPNRGLICSRAGHAQQMATMASPPTIWYLRLL